jgi:predicted nucleic acid-binding protein
MIAVSNTTPLRYLVAIEQQGLLGKLFDKVLISVAVRSELTDARTPERVRDWILRPPVWLDVREVEYAAASTISVALHPGEREAILLAESTLADVLLIDEQLGRAVALQRRLPVSGTLGLLERADGLGFLRDFPETIQRLRASGFFISESLERQLLARHRSRHSAE